MKQLPATDCLSGLFAEQLNRLAGVRLMCSPLNGCVTLMCGCCSGVHPPSQQAVSIAVVGCNAQLCRWYSTLFEVLPHISLLTSIVLLDVEVRRCSQACVMAW